MNAQSPPATVPGGSRADIEATFRRRLPHWARWAWRPLIRAVGLRPILEAWPELEHLEGGAFIDAALARLGIRIERTGAEATDLARPGPLVLLSNHHLGILDGFIALSLALPERPDTVVLGNRIVTAFPQLAPVVTPVAPPSAGTSRPHEARHVLQLVRSGRALFTCPAGQVADRGLDGRVHDRPWSARVGRLIRRAGADVVTLTIEGEASRAFYAARAIHFRLGTAMLLRELVAQRGRTVPVHVGRRIGFAELEPLDGDAALMAYLREVTYRPLGAQPTRARPRPLRSG